MAARWRGPGVPRTGAAADAGRLHRAAIYGIFLILLVAGLGYAQAILLPLTAALLVGLLFGPLQTRLERRGLPAALVATLIVLGIGMVILGALRMLMIPFETWSARLPEIQAALKTQLLAFREVVLAVKQATDSVQATAGLEGSGAGVGVGVVDTPGVLGDLAFGVPAAVGQLVLVFGALFFFLAARTRLRAGLLSLCMDRAARLKAARIIQDAEQAVSRYLGTIAVINLCLAVATGFALNFFEIENPWFWGALAGILNFVPYVGPAIMTLLLLGVGMLQVGAQGITIFMPALIFFSINFVEANFVTPAVLGRSMTIEPLLVIISLAFWLWIWGPVAGLIAVPVLLVIQVTIARLVR